MKVNGQHYRTIWVDEDGWSVKIIDQTKLPHSFEIITLQTVEDAAHAIKSMQVRGAPLIGVTAAYGICLALREDPSDEALEQAITFLADQRPTAVNLQWALKEMKKTVTTLAPEHRTANSYMSAAQLCNMDIECNKRIGENALPLIREISERKDGKPVNILTHCNAGWLACVDWGTATSPIYQAHDAGIAVHVWVDETRPRNQGAALTAFELGAHGVPHTLIVDNAGGHLMQHNQVDICFVGSDRTTGSGDVANKIGTYLKALAAKDNNIPFYVTLPYSTIDWDLDDGFSIPIEERDVNEVLQITGKTEEGTITTVDIAASGTSAANYAFDVTPARLVTGLITERGICEPTQKGLLDLYPERIVSLIA